MWDAANLINPDYDDATFGDGAFFCVEGIVAENNDPENRCRVQCLIPVIDENEIYQKWVQQLQLYVGGNGFGSYFVPEIGAEVLLIGKFGDVHNLFYAPIYHESIKPSSEFSDKTTFGFHVPNNLKLIADELAQTKAKNIEAIAEETAKTQAQNVEINAEEEMKIEGGKVTINVDGSVSISGGNINITGTSVKILGRTVLNNGQPI